MIQTEIKPSTQSRQSKEIPIEGFDYIEFYVGNAKQACYYYKNAFGFDLVGYRGLETGDRETTSYILKQNDIKIVLTSSQLENHEISKHVKKHGDGVKSIGFRVKDAKACYEMAIENGGISFLEPVEHDDSEGKYVSASVKTYGDTVHTFIQRENFKGYLAPGYEERLEHSGGVGLNFIDHIVGNVETDNMNDWVTFYEKVFGFYKYQAFDKDDITTQYSALASSVMANKSTSIKMPINEPAKGLRKSQIQEYLDYYNASGVQHIAVTTDDICQTVKALRDRGVDFLTVPDTYYDNLLDRVGAIEEDIEKLRELGILVDRESDGYLLQIFTKPVEDRPTLFFEIIERKGATGFGKGNFMALFESIEREQEKRGNL